MTDTDAIATANPLGDAHSKVELVDMMGGDLTVVNAARVSYQKRSHEMTPRDVQLVHRMMRLRHGSPFEHVVFQFRVRAPLHVVHQWERHRVASYNEESGRWVEMRGDFFTPDSDYAHVYELQYGQCYATYQYLLEHGEPKEDARLVLPISLYKEFYFTANVRSLLNFFSLRSDPEAQRHIRAYAEAMEDMITDFVPSVIAAFEKYGRRQP